MSERWIWTQKEDIGPSPRYGLAMAYEAARQRVVLFGGEVDPNTWEWDGVAWTQVADMGPPGRWYCGMVYDDSRQRLVLFGGVLHPDNPSRALGDTWEWDGTDWTQVADMGPSPRYGCAMTYDTVHKRVVLFGGNDPSHGELFYSTTRGNGRGQNGIRSRTAVLLNDNFLRWHSIVHASAQCSSAGMKVGHVHGLVTRGNSNGELTRAVIGGG